MAELAFQWFVVAADASLKVILLALLVAAGIWIFRVRNSAVRHAAWFSVLLALSGLPLLTVVLPSLQFPVPARLGFLLPGRVENLWQPSNPNERTFWNPARLPRRVTHASLSTSGSWRAGKRRHWSMRSVRTAEPAVRSRRGRPLSICRNPAPES
jgi:hypothetical protein